MSKGQFEIINNEGMICYVNTDKEDSEFYGKVWSDICKSKLEGIVLDGIIDRYQYRTMNGEPVSDKPTGFIVKIQDKVEAFLPMSNAAWRNSEEDCIGTQDSRLYAEFDSAIRRLQHLKDQIVDNHRRMLQQAHLDNPHSIRYERLVHNPHICSTLFMHLFWFGACVLMI